jgi:hypothetical protein
MSARTFTLTEAQRKALSFAALCEAESLATGREKREPEVQEAVRSLYEARDILEARPRTSPKSKGGAL